MLKYSGCVSFSPKVLQMRRNYRKQKKIKKLQTLQIYASHSKK